MNLCSFLSGVLSLSMLVTAVPAASAAPLQAMNQESVFYEETENTESENMGEDTNSDHMNGLAAETDQEAETDFETDNITLEMETVSAKQSDLRSSFEANAEGETILEAETDQQSVKDDADADVDGHVDSDANDDFVIADQDHNDHKGFEVDGTEAEIDAGNNTIVVDSNENVDDNYDDDNADAEGKSDSFSGRNENDTSYSIESGSDYNQSLELSLENSELPTIKGEENSVTDKSEINGNADENKNSSEDISNRDSNSIDSDDVSSINKTEKEEIQLNPESDPEPDSKSNPESNPDDTKLQLDFDLESQSSSYFNDSQLMNEGKNSENNRTGEQDTEKSVHIRFDTINIESGKMNEFDVLGDFAIPQSGFQKAGHTFSGWKMYVWKSDTFYYYSSSGNFDLKENGDVARIFQPDEHLYTETDLQNEKEIWLEAVWTPITFTISYFFPAVDSADEWDSCGSSPVTVTYGVKYIPDLTDGKKDPYRRKGKTLVGYTAKRKSDGRFIKVTDHTDDRIFRLIDDLSRLTTVEGDTVELYAVYKKQVYTLSFSQPPSAKGYMESYTAGYDELIGLENTLVRDGFHTYLWACYSGHNLWDLEDFGVRYLSPLYRHRGLCPFNNGVARLTPMYEENYYYYRKDSNNGTGKKSEFFDVLYTQKITPSNNYKKEGYTFDYWLLKSKDGKYYASHKKNPCAIDNPFGVSKRTFASEEEAAKEGFKLDRYYKNQTVSQLTPNYEERVTLVCQWKPNTFTVQYNANGGSGTMNSTSITYDQPEKISGNTFTRTGYTFNGWNAKDPSGNWICTKKDPETGEMLTKSFASQEEAEAEGYALKTYADETELSRTTSVNNGVVTLYAIWKPNTFTVQYDANGGSGTMNSTTITYDQPKRISRNKFTRTGYTFIDWIAKDPSGNWICTKKDPQTDEVLAKSFASQEEAEAEGYALKTYADGTKLSRTTSVNNGVVTLYARWKPNTFTVQYDPSYGSGSMESTSITYSVPKKISKNTFTKPGFAFNDWIAKDPSGKYICIKKDPQTGKLLVASFASETEAKKKGYALKRYVDEAELSRTTSVNNGIVTLSACWKPNFYTVQYNANGGSGSMNSTTITYDQPKKISGNTFTRTGYTFNGWTAKDPSGKWICIKKDPKTGTVLTKSFASQKAAEAEGYALKTYADKTELSRTTSVNKGVITMYARWKPNTYTIRFNANGGTGTMSNQSITYGENTNVKANSFSKTGYLFDCWHVKDPSGNWICSKKDPITKELKYKSFKDASTAAKSGYSLHRYPDRTTATKTTSINKGTVTFTAQWKPITYTIQYQANGGKGFMPNSTIKYNSGSKPLKNAFTLPGYTFSCWYAKDPSGNWICSRINSKTGKREWKSFKTVLQAKKAGYSLHQYPNGTSACTTTAINKGKVTFIAKWKRNSYTIKYQANGGSGTMPAVRALFGIKKTLPKNQFTRKGYKFTGWTVKVNNGKQWLCSKKNAKGEISYRFVADKDLQKARKEGYSKHIYANGTKVSKVTPVNNDTVYLYANWTKTR